MFKRCCDQVSEGFVYIWKVVKFHLIFNYVILYSLDRKQNALEKPHALLRIE